MICSFFGHRDSTEDIYWFVLRISELLIEKFSVDTFYIGDNGKFDRMAFLAMTGLQKKYRQISYQVVTAYMPRNTHRFKDVNSLILTYPEGFEYLPKAVAIPRRNKWMVDKSDIVIGYVKYPFGGAATAYNYANKQKKVCFNIADPDSGNESLVSLWNNDLIIKHLRRDFEI